jgi:hypothetical protein
MHRVDVGGGSADIRQSAPLRWTGPRDPRLPDAGRAGFNEGF